MSVNCQLWGLQCCCQSFLGQMSYYGQNWIILNVSAIISRSTQMSGSRWRPWRCLGAQCHSHSIRCLMRHFSSGLELKMSHGIICWWVQAVMIVSRLRCDDQGACEEGRVLLMFYQHPVWLLIAVLARPRLIWSRGSLPFAITPPGLLVYLAEGRSRV